jgi:hypothetical protein
MTTSNATVIRKAYADFAQSNIPAVLQPSIQALFGMFLVIVSYQATIPGTIRSAASFNAPWSFSGGAFSIDVDQVLAEGDVVVVLTTVNAQRRGVSGSFPEVHVWQMRESC